MSSVAKISSLEALEEYYRKHFEIALLPIAQRPLNPDILTRTEREILDCTTKIDNALGSPTIMDVKPDKTFKKGFNVNSAFECLLKSLSPDLYVVNRVYNFVIRLILLLCNFTCDIALTLYGPSICGIIEIFFGDGSIIHLFLLCVVASVCVFILIFLNCSPVYLILSGFPILWQVALALLPLKECPSIPAFIERLTSSATDDKTPRVVESNWNKLDNLTFTIKPGESKRLTPEERAITLLKRLENDPY